MGDWDSLPRERSLFANHLAEMFRHIDLARQYYLSVTWQVMHPEIYGQHWTPEMIAKYSAARSFAGDCAKFVCNLGMEMMGSYGSYEFNLEKYMRDYKITQMWLGGAQRDRLDIAQGLCPFKQKWGGRKNETKAYGFWGTDCRRRLGFRSRRCIHAQRYKPECTQA